MHKGHDDHPFGGDLINESIAFDEKLPDFRGTSFRDDSASLGQALERPRRSPYLANQGDRIERGIAGDELGGFRKVSSRCFGPS
jgi:hypothetical protein